MDVATARSLAQLTQGFYVATSASFSATRQAPWRGWQQVVDRALASDGPLASDVLRAACAPLPVLDLACGNLRFERYLGERLAERVRDAAAGPLVRAHAVDSCDSLAVGSAHPLVDVCYQHLDVAGALFADDPLAGLLEAHACRLAVCFGFMHHLALPEHRAAVLDALCERTVPGTLVVVSFWQLSHSARLLAKAQATTQRAQEDLGFSGLDEGDYLLGWQDRSDVLRYCHDFAEQEIDELVARVAGRACELDRFSADGAAGNLNRYVVLQVR